MSIRVWTTPLFAADMSGTPTQFQPIRPTKNRVIASVRCWLSFINNPDFSTAEIRIYTMVGESLGRVLATSNGRRLSSMITKTYGTKNVHFEFSKKPSLRKGETYAIVLFLNNYNGIDSSYVGWNRETAPYMPHESAITIPKINQAPYSVEFIGDRF